jgi:peroxiredoxin
MLFPFFGLKLQLNLNNITVMHKVFLAMVFCTGALFASALQEKNLQNGQWRATLERKDGKAIVFNFEVKDSAGKKIAYIKNAGERLLVDDIVVRQDSVFITLPFFESQIHAVIEANTLKGIWIKRLTDKNQVIAFSAFYGQPYRFKTITPPAANVTGRWAVVFSSATNIKTLDVGEFVQQGNRVTGTFLDPTGDYRYLEGVVDGDSLKLSCFDGGHAYLFTAKVENDHAISGGQYFSGPTARQVWTAKKDENAQLPNEFSLTKLKEGQSRFDFTFRDIDGKTVSIRDDRFKNKVVVIQIMGSWCPNCMDETAFLSGFYETYKTKGVEVIGLAYERSTDFERSQNSLRRFQKSFNVQYPLLITGVSVDDKLRSEKTLPQLQKIEGFPTTIFIDKQGNVSKIHTGFNGPATGKHYEEEKKTFYKTVEALL